VPYSVEFVRVPRAEMDARLGLAVLVRRGDQTRIYCRGDMIHPDLARGLSTVGTAFSRASVRVDEPVGPPLNIAFERLAPEEMPDDIQPNVSAIKDGTSVTYMRSDMITADMCHALELLCTEQTRYLIRMPAVLPTAT
jgi:hypothetical protein